MAQSLPVGRNTITERENLTIFQYYAILELYVTAYNRALNRTTISNSDVVHNNWIDNLHIQGIGRICNLPKLANSQALALPWKIYFCGEMSITFTLEPIRQWRPRTDRFTLHLSPICEPSPTMHCCPTYNNQTTYSTNQGTNQKTINKMNCTCC